MSAEEHIEGLRDLIRRDEQLLDHARRVLRELAERLHGFEQTKSERRAEQTAEQNFSEIV